MYIPHTQTPRVFHLGDLAPARGKHNPVHGEAATRGTALIGRPSSYTQYSNPRRIICVDYRLSGAAGLAGGALSLAVMFNYLFGGDRLSHALAYLRETDAYLSLHEECGALRLTGGGFIQRHLTDVNAAGYRFLAGIGYDIPMQTRRKIAAWARGLPADFVDLDRSLGLADEILNVSGSQCGGFVGVSLAYGYGFMAHKQLERETGMGAYRFDPAAAFREAGRMTDDHTKAEEAANLVLILTAEVLLELGGPRMIGGIYR